MRVLIVEPRHERREWLVGSLDPGRFRVAAVSDAKSALKSMAAARPDVVLVGWPETLGRELLRILASGEGGDRVYVVVACDRPLDGALVRDLVAGGAHDFFELPASPEELIARVEAPRRLRAWASAVSIDCRVAGEDDVDVARIAAWREMGGLVATVLGDMLGPVRVAEGWPASMPARLHGALLCLSLPSSQVELHVSVGTDIAGGARLAERLVGDPHAAEDVVADVMCELANGAAGAVKRASLREAVTWTTGIPESAVLTRAEAERGHCWTLSASDEVALVLAGRLVERRNERVAAARLQEGMIVVHDVRNTSGALLVPAGTRLTSTTAARVARVLDGRTVVEVAAA